jgi:hypothetical protein
MKENLIIGIFEFLKLFEDSLNFVFMHISLFDQEKIIDISIVGKLIRYQLQAHCESFVCWPQVAHLCIETELLILNWNLFFGIVDLKKFHRVFLIL